MFEDATDLRGVEPFEQDGLMWFTRYDEEHDMEILYTIVGMTAEGELELSVSFEYWDGTYGGSEWFYVRAD